ncbi:hypothetical protein BW97_17415 [Escherichia coli O69:H11 str. 07-4281]|nr:hypothetical protein BW97_17415 [Escherichia coli O69:H11 str. 07-4281]EYZ75394.1 hypothetical protein BW85_11505 [Escherichia coli O69:H11 str. 06-3325]KDV35391.1 NinB protein [Escherichia coli O69:H11 str. 07-3763]
MRFSTIVSVVTLVWGISPRQPSGKNIIRWLLKKRTNGSVRYCQYTSQEADVLPGLEGEYVNIRESSAQMSVKRMASLIEYTTAWAIGQGVRFTDRRYE